MTTQHTPGPWFVSTGTTVRSRSDELGLPIVVEAFSKPDARLIAAAPDLLRALSAIVENADKGYSVTTWTGLDGIADAGTVANLDAARSAIARATGGGA